MAEPSLPPASSVSSTDPQFTTRAELDEWTRRERLAARWITKQSVLCKITDRIKRVTLAHAHLENDDG